MSEQNEPRREGEADGRTRIYIIDLLAFFGVLMFVGALTLFVHASGQLPARLAFIGAASMVAASMTAWRRLRRPVPRRWHSGQVVYCGRRVKLASAWGVEGRSLPMFEPSVTASPNTSEAAIRRYGIADGTSDRERADTSVFEETFKG